MSDIQTEQLHSLVETVYCASSTHHLNPVIYIQLILLPILNFPNATGYLHLSVYVSIQDQSLPL